MVMFDYAISILPLAKKMKVKFLTLHQPWYMDDVGAGAGAIFANTGSSIK
jgi:hypothetical protein